MNPLLDVGIGFRQDNSSPDDLAVLFVLDAEANCFFDSVDGEERAVDFERRDFLPTPVDQFLDSTS